MTAAVNVLVALPIRTPYRFHGIGLLVPISAVPARAVICARGRHLGEHTDGPGVADRVHLLLERIGPLRLRRRR
ncbi:hypothetical protein [Streptomyces sp. NPDC017993]|uniref:hypothetical protein n=1 Tax=Streptomyces sp. NPDC017993 TaxID=3365027 RepID=UPI003796A17F